MAAFVAFLGAIWTGPNTDLSLRLGATGSLCLGTAVAAAVVGGLILAGQA